MIINLQPSIVTKNDRKSNLPIFFLKKRTPEEHWPPSVRDFFWKWDSMCSPLSFEQPENLGILQSDTSYEMRVLVKCWPAICYPIIWLVNGCQLWRMYYQKIYHDRSDVLPYPNPWGAEVALVHQWFWTPFLASITSCSICPTDFGWIILTHFTSELVSCAVSFP